MALFVRASRIAPMDEQALPPLAGLSSAKPAMRGPGFFGRLGNRLRNADWQMAFAQMRDDPSFAENLLAHRENAAEQSRREAEAESQRVAAKGQNEQLRGAIEAIHPGDAQAQALDWADPVGAIRQYREAQAPPEWGDPMPLNGGTAQRNRRTGEIDMLTQPRQPSAAIIMGQNNPDTVGYMADYIQQNGAPPPNAFTRNPALAREVYAELARRRAGGEQGADPGRISEAGASYAANRQGLGRLITQRSLVQSFERTARSNLELAQRLSREVPRNDWPIINQALLTGQRQTGNTATARYINALIGARTEYAKVLSGATGAQGLTDAARRESEEMFSQYANPDTIDGLIDVARTEMDNRIRAFDEQEAYIRGQINGTRSESESVTTPSGANNRVRGPIGGTRERTFNPATGRLE